MIRINHKYGGYEIIDADNVDMSIKGQYVFKKGDFVVCVKPDNEVENFCYVRGEGK
jgi:hypothetical protein